ncbi:hypothetical protein CTAYLR_003866 [Chrysophaeum taylorii]|uniref:Uncharacterized protein n=1 Tax=Chrysophaeum taylorii TaxID=2483200 RepID=A0AAD7UL39_9STRA|nr:hypothetical protein CTAYLR_003866 [Chrysophaeum taylorii]
MDLSAAVLFGWPYVSLVLAIAGIMYASNKTQFNNVLTLIPFMGPFYSLHQFEEHGIDLLGRRYALAAHLCHTLGFASKQTCPADPLFVFMVNFVGVNLTAAINWALFRTEPVVATFAWGTPFFNTLSHVMPALLTQSYNPGLATAILLFAPGSFFVLRGMAALMPKSERPILVFGVFIAGLIDHAIIVVTLWFYEKMPYSIFQLINGLNGITPIAIGYFFSRNVLKGDPKTA